EGRAVEVRVRPRREGGWLLRQLVGRVVLERRQGHLVEQEGQVVEVRQPGQPTRGRGGVPRGNDGRGGKGEAEEASPVRGDHDCSCRAATARTADPQGCSG